jgi:AraC-like DNA-binding protein
MVPRTAVPDLTNRHLTRVSPGTPHHRLLGYFFTALAEELPAMAAGGAISLRTLHGVFAVTGESVSTFVRRRRLENS